MATAGYSGTPLATKLGIKDRHRVSLVNAPDGFEDSLAPLPAGVKLKRQARGEVDVVVFFTKRTSELVRRLPALASNLEPSGGLWIAWPKKTSGVETDVSFDVAQRAGLDFGLVDNKICAIDDVWSGLRMVVRVVDRPKRTEPNARKTK
jgi:hypothetical protein